MTPYLGPNKKCPDCWERLQSLKKIDAVPAAFQQANELYVQNNEGAKELENKLFASIFGPNNLIKFAAEEQEEENAETPIDPNTDPDVSVPTQETPEDLEQPVEQPTEQTTEQPQQPTQEQQPDQMQQAEMQLTSLLDMIAQDIMAQINANPDEEFSEEEIMQMFQEKMAKLQSS